MKWGCDPTVLLGTGATPHQTLIIFCHYQGRLIVLGEVQLKIENQAIYLQSLLRILCSQRQLRRNRLPFHFKCFPLTFVSSPRLGLVGGGVLAGLASCSCRLQEIAFRRLSLRSHGVKGVGSPLIVLARLSAALFLLVPGSLGQSVSWALGRASCLQR